MSNSHSLGQQILVTDPLEGLFYDISLRCLGHKTVIIPGARKKAIKTERGKSTAKLTRIILLGKLNNNRYIWY